MCLNIAELLLKIIYKIKILTHVTHVHVQIKAYQMLPLSDRFKPARQPFKWWLCDSVFRDTSRCFQKGGRGKEKQGRKKGGAGNN